MKVRTVFRIALISFMVLTVLFIFSRSMKPPSESAEESNKVSDIVAEIIPPDTPPGEYVQNNIRKIAHFVEFAVLGAEAALYVIIFKRKLLFIANIYPIGLITALLDETIQIASGRGASVSDVWLDFSGFVSFSLLIFIIGEASIILRRKIKK